MCLASAHMIKLVFGDNQLCFLVELTVMFILTSLTYGFTGSADALIARAFYFYFSRDFSDMDNIFKSCTCFHPERCSKTVISGDVLVKKCRCTSFLVNK